MNINDLRIKIALLEMIEQFAYSYKKKEDGKEHLYTGGLSALESAFDVCELDNDCCIDIVEAKLELLYTELNFKKMEQEYMQTLLFNLDEKWEEDNNE